MSRFTHKPRIGDKVWVEDEQPQPNGYIKRIVWKEQFVIVFFHQNEGQTRRHHKEYSFEELDGHWEPVFLGGIYMMYKE